MTAVSVTTVALNGNAAALRRPLTLEQIRNRAARIRRIVMFTLIAVIVLPIPSDCGPEHGAAGSQANGNSQSR